MQNIITVCNRLCDKDRCPHHTAKIPNYFNPRLIKYINLEGAEECLRKEKKSK